MSNRTSSGGSSRHAPTHPPPPMVWNHVTQDGYVPNTNHQQQPTPTTTHHQPPSGGNIAPARSGVKTGVKVPSYRPDAIATNAHSPPYVPRRTLSPPSPHVVSVTSDQVLRQGIATDPRQQYQHNSQPVPIQVSQPHQQSGGLYRPPSSNGGVRAGVYDGVASYGAVGVPTSCGPPPEVGHDYRQAPQPYQQPTIVYTYNKSASPASSAPRAESPSKLPSRVQNKIEERRAGRSSAAPTTPRSRASSTAPSVHMMGVQHQQQQPPGASGSAAEASSPYAKDSQSSRVESTKSGHAAPSFVNPRDTPPPQSIHTPTQSPALSSSSKGGFSSEVIRVSSQNSSIFGARGLASSSAILHQQRSNPTENARSNNTLRIASTSTAAPCQGGTSPPPPAASAYANNRISGNVGSMVTSDLSVTATPAVANTSLSTVLNDAEAERLAASASQTPVPTNTPATKSNDGSDRESKQRLVEYLQEQQNTHSRVINNSELLEPAGTPMTLVAAHPPSFSDGGGARTDGESTGPHNSPAILYASQPNFDGGKDPRSTWSDIGGNNTISTNHGPPTPANTPTLLLSSGAARERQWIRGSVGEAGGPPTPPASPAALSVMQHRSYLPSFEGSVSQSFCAAPPGTPQTLSTTGNNGDGYVSSSGAYYHSSFDELKNSVNDAPPTPPSSPAWGVSRANVRSTSNEDILLAGSSLTGYPANPPGTPAQLPIRRIHDGGAVLSNPQRGSIGSEGATITPASTPLGAVQPLQPPNVDANHLSMLNHSQSNSAPANTPCTSFGANPIPSFDGRGGSPCTPANTPATLKPKSGPSFHDRNQSGSSTLTLDEAQLMATMNSHSQSNSVPANTPCTSFGANPIPSFDGGVGSPCTPANTPAALKPKSDPSFQARNRATSGSVDGRASPEEPPSTPAMGSLVTNDRRRVSLTTNDQPIVQHQQQQQSRRDRSVESEDEQGSQTPMQPLRMPDAVVTKRQQQLNRASISSSTPPTYAPSPQKTRASSQQSVRRVLHTMAAAMERDSKSKCMWAAWYKWSRVKHSKAPTSVVSVVAQQGRSTIVEDSPIHVSNHSVRSNSGVPVEDAHLSHSDAMSTPRSTPTMGHSQPLISSPAASLPPLGRKTDAALATSNNFRYIDPAVKTSNNNTTTSSYQQYHHPVVPAVNSELSVMSSMQPDLQVPTSAPGTPRGHSSIVAPHSPALSPVDYLKRRQQGMRTECMNEELRATQLASQSANRSSELSPIAAIRQNNPYPHSASLPRSSSARSGSERNTASYHTPIRTDVPSNISRDSYQAPPPLPLQSPGAVSSHNNDYRSTSHLSVGGDGNTNEDDFVYPLSHHTQRYGMVQRSLSNISNRSRGEQGGSEFGAVSRTSSFVNPFVRPDEYLKKTRGSVGGFVTNHEEDPTFTSMIRHYTSASYDPVRNNLERTMVSDADIIAEQMRAQARQITHEYLSSPERLREMRQLRTPTGEESQEPSSSVAPTVPTTRTASVASTSQPQHSASIGGVVGGPSPGESSNGGVVRIPTPSEYTHTNSMRRQRHGAHQQ